MKQMVQNNMSKEKHSALICVKMKKLILNENEAKKKN